MREELVRGYRVQPEYVCFPGESCVDLPEFNQLFNGQMMGSDLTNLKITITSDLVDCGARRVQEEVTCDKYNDYEAFSFS